MGRAVLPSLGKDGADGVAEYLKKMTEELAGMMARTASWDLAHIGPGLLWNAAAERPL